MSQILRYAVAGRVPLIAIALEDTIYTADVLADLTGVKDWTEYSKAVAHTEGGHYYVVSRTGVGPVSPVDWYKVFQKFNAVCIYTNIKEPPPEFLDLGPVAPSSGMLKTMLSGLVGDVDAAAASVGGMSIKDAITVATITAARDDTVTPAGMVQTRRALLKTSKGLTIVDPYLPAYKPAESLVKFVATNKVPFLKWHDSRLRPRGLLFDGPPGTGKTMAAKYIAREWGIPLFRIDATFQSKWVGETEENAMKAFVRAEEAQPCVLLIDEIEKCFGQTDMGIMSRVMSNMLWWLQEHEARVLTVMTTNDKKRIPPELHREGRIDQDMVFRLADKEEILDIAKVVWNSYEDGDLPPFLVSKFPEATPHKSTKIGGMLAPNSEYGTGISHAHIAKVVRDYVVQMHMNASTKEG